MADDIVTRLRVIHCAADDLTPCGTCLPCQAAAEIERLRVEANRWKGCQSLLTEAIGVIDSLKDEVRRQRTGKALLMLEEATAEIDILSGRINWMIDAAYAWDSDGCFTFPDGYIWRKPSV